MERERHHHTARPAAPDLTKQRVQEQVKGMQCPRYEIGVYDRQKDTMRRRTYTPDELGDRLDAWWEKNKRGADIYVAPAGSLGIILVDDLSRQQLHQMQQEGVSPSVIVRTSPPDNHQAWVRVHSDYLEPALATAVARELAIRYGGDRAGVSWNHLGRLAGYTNRKPERIQPNGMYPFVRLVRSQPHIAPAAEALLDAGRAQLERERAMAEASPSAPAFDGPPGPPVEELIEQYRAELAAMKQAHPEYTDQSRLDWTILRMLAQRHPGASRDDLIAVLVTASPQIEERKRRRVYAYAARTVDNLRKKQTSSEQDIQPAEEGKRR